MHRKRTTSRTRLVAVVSALALGVGAGAIGVMSAHADTSETVTAGTAKWGYKATFRSYIAEETGRSPADTTSPRASITPGDGAAFDGTQNSTRQPSVNKAPYTWPIAVGGGTYDETAEAGTINYAGKVTFVRPDHFINETTISNPSVVLNGDGTGKLYVDLTTDYYGGTSGTPQATANVTHVDFADLSGVPTPTSVDNGNGTSTETFTNIGTAITATGSAAVNNFYLAGDALDPLTITFTHGTAVATSTSTTLSTSPAGSAVVGNAVDLTATLSPAGAAGSVEFFDGATSLGTQPVASGTATVSSSALALGSHTLKAVFTPTDANAFAASTSSDVAFTVNPVPPTATTTTLATTPSGSVVAGNAVSLDATVSPVAAGSVEFFDGATSLGSQAVASGAAAISTSALTVGTHTLKATFTPTDAGAYASSTSANVTITVNAAAPADTTPVTGATLDWAISQYALTPPGGQAAWAGTTSGGATVDANHVYHFTGGTGSTDTTGKTVVSYKGTAQITTVAQVGAYLTITDPILTVQADGTGTVTASVTSKGTGAVSAAKRVIIAKLTGVNPTGTTTKSFTVAPDYVDAVPMGSFKAGYDDAFPVEFVSWLDPSIRSFFYQSGTNPTSDALKVPKPITASYSTQAASDLSAYQTITTTVVPTGALSISVDDNTVVLPSPALDANGDLWTTGAINTVKVVDLRNSDPGWTVNGQVTDFASSSGVIDGKWLGWTPNVVAAGTNVNTVNPGAIVAPGTGLKTAATLASAPAGKGRGTANLGASLNLSVPTTTVPDTYTATLTLTALGS